MVAKLGGMAVKLAASFPVAAEPPEIVVAWRHACKGTLGPARRQHRQHRERLPAKALPPNAPHWLGGRGQ